MDKNELDIIKSLEKKIIDVTMSENLVYDNYMSAEKRLPILNKFLRQTIASLETFKKNFKGYRVENVTTAAQNLIIEIEADIKGTSADLNIYTKSLIPRRHSKGGKPKVPEDVCVVILEAICRCEREKIQLDWLKNLLSSNGELKRIQKQVLLNELSSMPTPSLSTTGKVWLYKLKETLERSLFSPIGKISKKASPVYNSKKKIFYEVISSKAWQNDWRRELPKLITKMKRLDKKPGQI